MNNVTKMEIKKPARDVFEAFVDPAKIGNFWFSSSSERWAAGKAITLRYDEYDAEGVIQVTEVVENRKITYEWGAEEGEPHVVTITLEETAQGGTIISVDEQGFDERDPDLVAKLVDNKEGWVYALTCLKAYLEFGVSGLRAALVK